MPNLTGAISIRGIVARFSRLDAAGLTPAGATNGYIVKFVNLVITPEYRAGTEFEVVLADGTRCVDAQEQDVPRRVGLEVQVCNPDAELHELLAGYTLSTSGLDTIGAAFPAAGQVPTPNGVAIEAWSKRSNSDLSAPSGAGHYRWIVPRAYFQGGPKELTNGPMTHSFTGYGIENANFLNGPANDVPTTHPSSRAFSWYADSTVPPTAAVGYAATPTQT